MAIGAGGHSLTDELWRRTGLGCAALMPIVLALDQRAVMEVFSLLVAIGYGRHLWVSRSSSPRWSAVTILLIGLWAWMSFVVSPLAIEPGSSLARSIVWFRQPLFALAMAGWAVRDQRSLGLLALAWSASLLLVTSDAVVQAATGTGWSGTPIHGNGRLTGFLDRPNLATFTSKLGLPLVGAAALLLPGASRTVRGTALVTGGIALLAVALSGERSASLLTIVAVAGALALTALASSAGIRLAAIAGLAGLAGLLASILALNPFVAERARYLVAQVSDYGASIYGQLLASSWTMALERPIAGHGYRGFRVGCPPLKEEGRLVACELHPHNLYAEWLVDGGAVALVLFAAVAMLLVRELVLLTRAKAMRATVRPWVLATAFVTLFPLQVSQSFLSNWPGMLAWTGLGLALAVARQADASTGAAQAR